MLSRRSLVFALATITFTALSVFAQQVTGTITGTVVDQTNQSIVGATVTLVATSTNDTRTTTSNEQGAFTFPAVQPGAYSITVEHPGFKSYTRSDLHLTASQRLSVGDLPLSIGAVTESVKVTGVTASVQTASAENSAVITAKQTENILVRGRDVVSLLRTLPGVTYGGDQESVGGAYGTSTPNISGNRSSTNTMSLDGLSGNDLGTPNNFSSAVNMDAVGEVKVLLNNYQAEYGRNGGAMINVITKSGSRDFHGSGYWYKRHEQFNANDFFNNRNSLPKARYRYNTLGGTIGGPVYIPGKFNTEKDKLFFFYAIEDWRTATPQAIRQVTVPTALERAGDFSQSVDQNGAKIVVNDPTTGQAFPGNVIPKSRLDPNGQALLNVFPMPNALDRNLTKGSYNYNFQESLIAPKRSHLFKVDYLPTQKDRLFVRGSTWWSDQQGYAVAAGSSNWGLVQQHYTFTDNSIVLNWARVITPTLVHEFNGGVRHSVEKGPPLNDTELNRVVRSSVGFNVGQLYPQYNPLKIIPQASFGGVPNAAAITYDGRFPLRGADTVFNFNDSLTWIKGPHTMKFGIFAERARNYEGERSTFGGSFSFARDINNPFDTNYAYANAAIGNFQSYTESSSRYGNQARSTSIDWYAQDSWKVNRRLTVEYGLRFTWYTPWSQADSKAASFFYGNYDPSKAPVLYRPTKVNGNRVAQDPLTGAIFPAPYIGAFVPNSGNPNNGMVLATDSGYPSGFRDQLGPQLGPRIGVAYDPFGKGKTAIRAGAGMFYNTRPTGNFNWNLITNPPIQFNPNIYYGNMQTFLNSSGVLAPSNTYGFEKHMKTPTIYNLNFSIQQDIGWATLLDVAYVGSLGRHLTQGQNLNLVPYGAHFQPANQDPTQPGKPLNDNFFRPLPGYNNVNFYTNASSSSYHALQASVNRRFTRALQIGVAYTYSKAMDYIDDDTSSIATYVNPRVWNYGKAGFDQTHNLSINYIWDIPKLTNLVQSRPLGWVFDHWQLAGFTAFVSGQPSGIGFSTVDATDITGGGDGARVVMTGKAQLDHGDRALLRWFDPTTVARPAQGTIGNAPKDVFRKPGFANWDISLFKNIPIRSEARLLQYRMEMYNAFNHTQFNTVDSTARFDASGKQVNGTFGQVTSTRTPRVIQMSLRFTF